MPPATVLSRYGGWLPHSRRVHEAFFEHHLQKARKGIMNNTEHQPAVQEFKEAIESNPRMILLFDMIFLQVSPENKIPDFEHLLRMMDHIVVSAPRFQIVEGLEGEPIGVPLYLLFDLLSNTDAGHDLFRMEEFNLAMKSLLDSWGDYLRSPNSNNTLTDEKDGWFGPTGINSLQEDRGVFNETYVTPNRDAVNRGYTSWDDFFTREVQSTARPVQESDSPDINKTLVHNACESTVYCIAHEVKEHDQFWLKAQRYSLYDMLSINSDHSYVSQFVGGTVYQAFLSPRDYHRWRSPVDGIIEKAVTIPGTYYAAMPDDGAGPGDPDLPLGDPHGAIIRSQAWLTMSAARALIFIRANNPAIGLMCFIAVGMVEVSTCEVTVADGEAVIAGDQLGMFHFGGSSHALVFGPQAKITFADHVVPDAHIRINTILAQVASN